MSAYDPVQTKGICGCSYRLAGGVNRLAVSVAVRHVLAISPGSTNLVR